MKLFALIIFASSISCSDSDTDDEYTILYNRADLNDWTLMCRGDDPDLPQMVFTPGENGALHVFKDIPDSTGLNEGKNDTHGMIFTKNHIANTALNLSISGVKKCTTILTNINMMQVFITTLLRKKYGPEG
jgi:hypothetical protein